MRVILAACLVCGCANAELGAGPPDGPDAADDGEPDGGVGDEDAAAPDAEDAIDAAPTDAAPVDAAPVEVDAAPPDAPLPPDACVPTWIQLLGNPGFDDGVAPWTQQGTVITADADMPIAPQVGTHAAWLGGANAADDRLTQAVAIPADATALRVRVFECFVTADATGDDDHFVASLRTPAGVELEVLRAASNLQVGAVCGWTAATWTASAPHAGQTVELHLRGTTDASYPTSWYVDSLALEALACP